MGGDRSLLRQRSARHRAQRLPSHGWHDATEVAHRRGLDIPETVLATETSDGQAVNTSVTREAVPPGTSLDDYNAATRRLLAPGRRALSRVGIYPGEPETPRRSSLDGTEAITQELLNEVEGAKLRARMVVALRDRTGYHVILAPSDHFEDHLPQFEATLASRRWK